MNHKEKGDLEGQEMRLLRGNRCNAFNIPILCQYVPTFRKVGHDVGWNLTSIYSVGFSILLLLDKVAYIFRQHLKQII